MRKNLILSKTVVALTVILLITLSLNHINPVSASSINYAEDGICAEDGIWFDTFEFDTLEDDEKLEEHNHIKLENGKLLTTSSETKGNMYNFDGQTFDHEAFACDLLPTLFTFKGETPFFFKLSRKIFGEFPLTGDDYKVIAQENENYLEIIAPSLARRTSFSVMKHFRFKVEEETKYIDKITLYWKGFAKNASNIESYVWKYSQNQYIPNLGIWKEARNISESTDDPQSLLFWSTDVSKFIGPDNTIDFMIVVTPEKPTEACSLATDYVKLEITGMKGKHAKTGNATSIGVNPEDRGASTGWRWEKIIWDSICTGDVATVKIQVLNSSSLKPIPDDEFDNIEGSNSDGFIRSPVDISSLSTETYKNISLRAIFETDDLSETAYLDNWAVTWQKQKNYFTDKFSTDLRIDTSSGVIFDAGNISISEFSSDWPAFGKKSDNNRVCDGSGPTSYKKYWYTNAGIGGLFCSPVLSQDKIYAPSISKYDYSIFSFNTTESPDNNGYQEPVNKTIGLKTIEMSPAITDDLVIVGTAELGEENKIYAFNRINLSLKWADSLDKGKICYSASPTIANGKVFITSWGGSGLDNPYLNFITNTIGLKGNNEIIVLDAETGNELWSKKLPAASFSSPAVHNNMVFVGCENINKKNGSLFAFNENTGCEIWNESVGMIGRSSPVVSNGNVFIIAKEMVEPLKWITKLVVVDEYTGDEKWNITLDENITGWQNMPKDLIGYLKELGLAENLNNDLLKMYNLLGATTPVVHNGVVFAGSTDGHIYALDVETHKQKWNTALGISFNVPVYMVASPVVADGLVYAVTWDGIIFALNETSGSVEWNNSVDEASRFDINIVVSSPIVADGLLYISTFNMNNLEWRLFSIGSRSENNKARVVSTPISIPDGYWWDEFTAEVVNTSKTKITFSILDEYDRILGSGLNGSENILSDLEIITSNIKLCAELEGTSEDTPILLSWSVNWKEEKGKPSFDEDSFKSSDTGEGGWINNPKPDCSINAYDNEDNNFSAGLDVDTARYKIKYLKKDSDGTDDSDWILAECNDNSGAKKITMTARISEDFADTEIIDLKSITFTIKDLVGNTANSDTFELKMDIEKPKSQIISSFEDTTYNDLITIEAKASDNADSEIKNVALYYKYSEDKEKWSDWENVGDPVPSYFIWFFDGDENLGSGYYKFITIATDNAGNIEDKTKEETEVVLFDNVQPVIETDFKKEGYNPDELFSLLINFSDNFELQSIQYRLNNETTWNEIEASDIQKTKEAEWTLKSDFWNNLPENLEKIDYIMFKVTDTCENELITTNESSVTIIKPEESAEIYLDLSEFSNFQWDDEFAISADIPDDINVENASLLYKYSENKDDLDGKEWKHYGENKSNAPYEWEFKAKDGNGYYEFKIEVRDAEGNIHSSPVKTANVEVFSVIPILFLVILIIVLLVITGFILIRRKKERANI